MTGIRFVYKFDLLIPKCFMLYVNSTYAKDEHNIPKLNNEIMVVLSGIILITSLKS